MFESRAHHEDILYKERPALTEKSVESMLDVNESITFELLEMYQQEELEKRWELRIALLDSKDLNNALTYFKGLLNFDDGSAELTYIEKLLKRIANQAYCICTKNYIVSDQEVEQNSSRVFREASSDDLQKVFNSTNTIITNELSNVTTNLGATILLGKLQSTIMTWFNSWLDAVRSYVDHKQSDTSEIHNNDSVDVFRCYIAYILSDIQDYIQYLYVQYTATSNSLVKEKNKLELGIYMMMSCMQNLQASVTLLRGISSDVSEISLADTLSKRLFLTLANLPNSPLPIKHDSAKYKKLLIDLARYKTAIPDHWKSFRQTFQNVTFSLTHSLIADKENSVIADHIEKVKRWQDLTEFSESEMRAYRAKLDRILLEYTPEVRTQTIENQTELMDQLSTYSFFSKISKEHATQIFESGKSDRLITLLDSIVENRKGRAVSIEFIGGLISDKEVEPLTTGQPRVYPTFFNKKTDHSNAAVCVFNISGKDRVVLEDTDEGIGIAAIGNYHLK